MKSARPPGLEAPDRATPGLLQETAKQPLAAIGEKVGLSASSVVERIHKLEEAGVVTSYVALVDARQLGKDVTAFIGVCSNKPLAVGSLERQVSAIEDVLECHHVTGAHTLMVKTKTENTASLEGLIERIRAIEGVTRTETMVVLSTAMETPRVALGTDAEARPRASRRSGRSPRGGRAR